MKLWGTSDHWGARPPDEQGMIGVEPGEQVGNRRADRTGGREIFFPQQPTCGKPPPKGPYEGGGHPLRNRAIRRRPAGSKDDHGIRD